MKRYVNLTPAQQKEAQLVTAQTLIQHLAQGVTEFPFVETSPELAEQVRQAAIRTQLENKPERLALNLYEATHETVDRLSAQIAHMGWYPEPGDYLIQIPFRPDAEEEDHDTDQPA